MSAVETLTKVRELLASPERWTQGFFARDSAGTICNFADANAACWCLSGALARVLPEDTDEHEERYDAAGEYLQAALPERSRTAGYIAWQDKPQRTHAEVLALVDRAIEIARTSGGS